MTIKHVVLFQFKAEASVETVQTTYLNLLGLKDACVREETQKPYILTLTGGKSVSKEGLEGGFEYAFVAEFANVEDRDYYVNDDKVHKGLVGTLLPIVEKVVVVDYEF